MTGEHSVEIVGVSKRFGDLTAVDDVSLAIRRGEFFSLLGPSGCGKTTLLRMIGGFDAPTAGVLRIGGEDMTRVPPNRRPVNMVFQHYALFPHLTVAENVAFGLRYQRSRNGERAGPAGDAAKMERALALVQLAGYGGRRPGQLSGGQRQRVALARALVLGPEVLLLDEPLGALDQKLRQEMQVELKNLQRTLGITFIFVTHDQEEALTMSDRIAVMNRGRVEQVDAAARLFERPRTEFVAEFMGAANFFTARVRKIAGGELSLSLGSGSALTALTTFTMPDDGVERRPAQEVRLVVRPEKLDLRARDLSARGVPSLPVTVEDRIYQGVSTVWVVSDAAGGRFTVYRQNARPSADGAGFQIGDRPFLCWNPRHAVILDRTGD
jgi:spermidine/putrescine transport system ATP-binding protein